MGRKDKLRREKQARRRKRENGNLLATATAAKAAATTTVTPALPTPLEIASPDNIFPKSVFYSRAKVQFAKENNIMKLQNTLILGATEYGCIHSISLLGNIRNTTCLNRNIVHTAMPWFVEGAIRGSRRCTMILVTIIRTNAKRNIHIPEALMLYWVKMNNKYKEWCGNSLTSNEESARKHIKEVVHRKCAICPKIDTPTSPLRQCMGCSTYCYCSKMCQIKHWEEYNHSGECKQLKILNKYHKPYAKEIRDATIRGEFHPIVEKLRFKLGLSRPIEEYQELRDTNTHEGKSIDPVKYLVARDDGTVWVGSTPIPMGPFSATVTATATATATPTATTVCAAAKDDQSIQN